MTEAEISQAFLTALSSDNEQRRLAEQFLTSTVGRPGVFETLIKLANAHEIFPVRQSAVVYLKNQCKNWVPKKKQVPIADLDKDLMKKSVFQCVYYNRDEKIRSQYEEIIKIISSHDFPHAWPEIMDQIREGLATNDFEYLYTSMTVICQVLKKYEFSLSEDRKNIQIITTNFFPRIQELLAMLAEQEGDQARKLEGMILKAFWSSIYVDILDDVAELNSFGNWLKLIQHIFERPIDPALEAACNDLDSQERSEAPAWETKKYSAQIFHRLMQRYTDDNKLNERLKPLGQFFMRNYSMQIMKINIEWLYRRVANFQPSAVTNYLIKYLTQVYKNENVTAMLAPFIQQLVTDIMIPILYKTPSDEAKWIEDPIEYIRNEADLCKAYFTAKSSVVDFLTTIVEDGKFLGYMVELINQEIPTADLARKEALMYCLGSMKQPMQIHLQSNPHYVPLIEQLLITYVIPEFESSVGFLRARSCWIYAQFAPWNFSDEAKFLEVVQLMSAKMCDRELPVQIEAAIAFPHILNKKVAKDLILANLKDLFKIYINLMDRIDNEDLIDSFQSVVSEYSGVLGPYAADITAYLVQAFTRMVMTQTTTDEDSENEMAAVSVLTTINRILDSCKVDIALLTNLATLIAPAIHFCLSERGCEYFEEGLEALMTLTDALPMTENLLVFFPYLYKSQMGYGDTEPYSVEHTNTIVPVFSTYLYKYAEPLLNFVDEGQRAIQQVFTLIERFFSAAKDCYSDAFVAAKLLLCVIECNQGRIDEFIGPCMTLIGQMFAGTEKKGLKGILIEILSMIIWYNRNVIIDNLEATVATILTNHSFVTDAEGLKRLVIGLSALFTSVETLPAQIQAQLGTVLATTITIMKKIIKQKQDSQETGDDIPNMDNIDEMEKEIEQSSPEEQKAIVQRLLHKLDAKDYAADSDEDSEYSLYNDEQCLNSPIQAVNEIQFNKDVILALMRDNANFYNQLQASLSFEQRAELEGCWSSLEQSNF